MNKFNIKHTSTLMEPKSEILLKDDQTKISRFFITPILGQEQLAVQKLDTLVAKSINISKGFTKYKAENNPFEILLIEDVR